MTMNKPINEYHLSMKEYHSQAITTSVYPKKYTIIYPALKLAGEAGEVAEKVGKVLRDNDSDFSPAKRVEIIMELGDVLWYVAALARDLGVDLEYVAEVNLEKLRGRQERGTLQGSGDNR